MPGSARAGNTGSDIGATWWVEVSLEESAGAADAEARLRTRRPTPLRARGAARLDALDTAEPGAAREVAVARALAALAERLAACATDDLATCAHASATVVVLEAEPPAPCPRTPDDAPAYGRYPS
jgi:hypothetical protein